MLFDIEVVIHEVWDLDNTVYLKGPMALREVDEYFKLTQLQYIKTFKYVHNAWYIYDDSW